MPGCVSVRLHIAATKGLPTPCMAHGCKPSGATDNDARGTILPCGAYHAILAAGRAHRAGQARAASSALQSTGSPTRVDRHGGTSRCVCLTPRHRQNGKAWREREHIINGRVNEGIPAPSQPMRGQRYCGSDSTGRLSRQPVRTGNVPACIAPPRCWWESATSLESIRGAPRTQSARHAARAGTPERRGRRTFTGCPRAAAESRVP